MGHDIYLFSKGDLRIVKSYIECPSDLEYDEYESRREDYMALDADRHNKLNEYDWYYDRDSNAKLCELISGLTIDCAMDVLKECYATTDESSVLSPVIKKQAKIFYKVLRLKILTGDITDKSLIFYYI